MATTYETLSRNERPHFADLEIRRLVWLCTESFKTAEFYELLGHTKRSTLSIRSSEGFYNGQHVCIKACKNYKVCAANFW